MNKKELIQRCLDNLDKHFNTGLCHYFRRLYDIGIINPDEYLYLKSTLKKVVGKDNILKTFYDKRRVKTKLTGPFFWPMCQIEPRRAFLRYLYEK